MMLATKLCNRCLMLEDIATESAEIEQEIEERQGYDVLLLQATLDEFEVDRATWAARPCVCEGVIGGG